MKACDLILLNGNVLTITGEAAEALAVQGNQIVVVGKDQEIKALASPLTEVIDLGGKTVVPGFIDAHTHFVRMGLEETYFVNLTQTKSLEEALEKLRKEVKGKPKGEWIIGRGWDESRWKEKRYVTRDDLDKVAPKHPVVLIREDGHLFSVNTKAFEEAPLPGTKEVNKNKGIVREKAAWDLYQKIEPKMEFIVEAIREATKIAHSLGVTSIHDTVKPDYINAYHLLNKRNELNIRVYLNVEVDFMDTFIQTGLNTGFGDNFLKLGGIKILADGSIGAANAALLEPYLDQGERGKLNYQKKALTDFVGKARTSGFQTAIHAIGDRAIQTVLEAFIKGEIQGDERHRLEHLELVTEKQIEKIRNLGIIASMQPNFLKWGREDGLYQKRLGLRRSKRINPFKKLLNKGIKLAFGSDCMPFSSLYGVHQVVNAPYDSQRLSIEEALKCYTLNSAYASFEEEIKGSIEEGKLADLIVLSEDPFGKSKRIEEIKVEMTFLNGQIVFSC